MKSHFLYLNFNPVLISNNFMGKLKMLFKDFLFMSFVDWQCEKLEVYNHICQYFYKNKIAK